MTEATRPRRITRSARGLQTSDGAGVKLTRIIGSPLLRHADPFLMLDEFGSDKPDDYIAGFPPHPHRGFETITYMIAGRFRHKDNRGHEGLLEAGGAQWMTAGKGIIHSEMPEQREGRVAGFQLWLNLPRKDKLCEPSYRDIPPNEVPQVTLENGATARLLAGTIGAVSGPIAGRDTSLFYADVSLPPRGSTVLPIPEGHEAFVYPFQGDVLIDGRKLVRGELGLLSAGDSLCLRSDDADARVLVVGGRPIGEPIVQHGPFVMTTRDEIEQAIRDYQSGRF